MEPTLRRDLANARMGQFVGLDGRTFSLLTARIEATEVEALIEAGCPVVTYFPGGRLQWHDEDDAWPAWADARSAPEPVTAGRRESPDGGTAVVLVWMKGPVLPTPRTLGAVPWTGPGAVSG